jgi:hypothetical protein
MRQGMPQWMWRSVLVLAVSALSFATIATPAGAAAVTVDQLIFTVPLDVSRTLPEASLGSGWQWLGRSSGGKRAASTVVLARADLQVSDPDEILGLVLAGSAAGVLPDLRIGDSRTTAMPGEGVETRVNLTYVPEAGVTYHGALLMATRGSGPAALLVVLGDDQLTAGTIDAVLGSARWAS